MPPRIGYSAGTVFGRWTLIESKGFTLAQQQRWLCRCSCGEEKIVLMSSLQSGGSTGCGCARYTRLKKKFISKKRFQQKNFANQSVNGLMHLSPELRLQTVPATRDTVCTFCGRDGFVQKNINHYQIISGDTKINMCYGCSISVGDLLWKEFVQKEYKRLIEYNPAEQ